MSHRGTERTEGYQSKHWWSWKYRLCVKRRRLFANSISNLYTKHLPQNSYQESVRYTSVALCAVGTSVILPLSPSLRDSVCLLYKTFSLLLHISEEPNKRCSETIQKIRIPETLCSNDRFRFKDIVKTKNRQ